MVENEEKKNENEGASAYSTDCLANLENHVTKTTSLNVTELCVDF